MDGYRHRIMDSLLEKKLQAKGAVLIEGPKWCGKTTTAEEIAASKILLARTDVKNNFKSLLEIDTDAALSGDTPMLIDEWQTVPKLWDAVRYTVDHRRKMGQFILTGSAVPDRGAEEEREHSGTGRFAWLTMRPMTLFESGESNGKVSLGNLFTAPEKILEKNELKLQDIAFLICRGGWPMAVGLPKEAALEQAFDYYDAVYFAYYPYNKKIKDIWREDYYCENAETFFSNEIENWLSGTAPYATNPTLQNDQASYSAKDLMISKGIIEVIDGIKTLKFSMKHALNMVVIDFSGINTLSTTSLPIFDGFSPYKYDTEKNIYRYLVPIGKKQTLSGRYTTTENGASADKTWDFTFNHTGTAGTYNVYTIKTKDQNTLKI